MKRCLIEVQVEPRVVSPAQLNLDLNMTPPHIYPNSEALIRYHLQECAAPCATGTPKNGLYLNEDDF